jgi:hypothetical protein
MIGPRPWYAAMPAGQPYGWVASQNSGQVSWLMVSRYRNAPDSWLTCARNAAISRRRISELPVFANVGYVLRTSTRPWYV